MEARGRRVEGAWKARGRFAALEHGTRPDAPDVVLHVVAEVHSAVGMRVVPPQEVEDAFAAAHVPEARGGRELSRVRVLKERRGGGEAAARRRRGGGEAAARRRRGGGEAAARRRRGGSEAAARRRQEALPERKHAEHLMPRAGLDAAQADAAGERRVARAALP